MLDSRIKNAILITVTSVWAANFLAGLIPTFHYHPDQTINGIFMGIVGGVFALSAKRDHDEGDKGKSDE